MGSYSSKQKSQRTLQPVMFILKATLNYFGMFYEVVSKENIQLGDILLFPTLKPSSNSNIINHAGVYCGNRQVVHFDGDGKVLIEGIDAMERKRGKCQILRLKQEIDEEAFQKKVVKMLNAEATYDFFQNNCIHFALSLLDKAEFYHKIVDRVEVDDGNDEGNQMLPRNGHEDRHANLELKVKEIRSWLNNAMDGNSPTGRACIACATGA